MNARLGTLSDGFVKKVIVYVEMRMLLRSMKNMGRHIRECGGSEEIACQIEGMEAHFDLLCEAFHTETVMDIGSRDEA